MYFSERALKSKNSNIELLENAFWSNIYMGNINRSLKIISEVELLSDEHDQKFDNLQLCRVQKELGTK